MENHNTTSINTSSKDPNIQIKVEWDLFGGESVDLDATVVVINEYGTTVDAVYYNKLESDCGSIVHSGDQGTDGADHHEEVININLSKINYTSEYLVLMINSYNG